MTGAEQQACTIYELICATSADFPIAFRSVEQAKRETEMWQATNPAFEALKKAPPEVLLAFLRKYKEWRSPTDRRDEYKINAVMSNAVQLALATVPKPLPPDLVLELLRGYGRGLRWMMAGFPLREFLSLLTRAEMTDEIRGELRNMLPSYAPSATGKIEPHLETIRKLITGLVWVEGEKQLDPGRGPWSQIVFDEVRKEEELARAGWESLLEHCRLLEQTVPGAKWNTRARELMAALGRDRAIAMMLRWLALGPTPGQPRDATSPIEDSAYQKGVIWCLGTSPEREVAQAITEFTLACLRKIPMLGAVSQKVGFAGVQALGAMECAEAVAQLTRLRTKVKYAVALKLIEKSLEHAALRNGMSSEELQDLSVQGYGLDEQGTKQVALGDAVAELRLASDGSVAVSWRDADGKLVASAPRHIKKPFAKEVRALSSLAKELEEAYRAQRVRLESSFVAPRSIPLQHWRQYYLEHPLLGFLGRRLIWTFSDSKGWERSGIWWNGEICDQAGNPLSLPAREASGGINVRLWHPLASQTAELQRWRERIFLAGVRQPFRQAFREFYQVTNEERGTRMYSNRFAGIYLRQHQLASLCRARGWEYRLMGASFDGHNVPTRKLSHWKMEAELHVDLPPDRDPSLRDSALGEQSGSGINLFVESDQVRFYRDRREVAVDEVPALVYSEVMRDVDLFTTVCAIGEDENWRDAGDRGIGVLGDRMSIEELTAAVSVRADILRRVLPRTPIADRSRLEPFDLYVQGQLGRYRISLLWGLTAMVADSKVRWLKIPQKLLTALPVDITDLPIELDYRTEMILRKAYLLANDWEINDPELIRQFMPK